MLARLALFALLFATFSAPPAIAQDPPIDWAMPPRLGPDANGDGLIDYANSATEFEQGESAAGGFLVELRVRLDLCKKGVTYTWRSAAGEISETGGPGCRVTQTFPTEGRYPVELTVRKPGGKTLSYQREITVRDWLIVSIGDSVASGEGNPDIPSEGGEKAKWESPRCHRSAKAAPAQAALALEAADPQTSTTFVHLACSGAKVSTGLLRPYKGLDNPLLRRAEPLAPQVDELERIARKRQVDAVLISIGANDVYFGPIVKFCLQWHACIKKRFKPSDPRHSPGPLPDVVKTAIARLKDEYDALALRLSGVTLPSHVLITDYFDPTRDGEGRFCERIGTKLPFGRLQIDKEEAEWAATKILQPVNQEIATAAGDHGWTEVSGIAEAFRNHGYCADESWIVHFKESFFRQIGDSFFSRVAGFLHPNEKGHEEEGAMIGHALSEVLSGGSPPDHGTDVVVVREVPEDPDESSGEETAEEAAEIALVAGAAAAGLIGAGARIRRRRLRRLAGDPWTPGSGSPPLDLPEVWPRGEEVKRYGELLENLPKWIHRRVESVEILDERMVRRRVSVDFTPELPQWRDAPGPPPPTHAPIALLSKRILLRFDLRDETGSSVALATSEENAAYAAAYLLQLAKKALDEEPPDELRRLCWEIARGDPDQARAALTRIASGLTPRISRRLRKDKGFRTAVATFGENFAVLVEVGQPPRRRVLKLAYDHAVEGGELKLRQRLGLVPVLMSFWIPELGDAASRHLEFLSADGLEILGTGLVWRPEGEEVQRVPGVQYGGEAHLRINHKARGTKALAGGWVRASRSALLVGAPWLAALSAGALTAAWFALPGLAGDSSGGAPSILLAIPAVLGAYLGSRQPHPLEAAMLWGARGLLFLSGALAFVGAGTIALEPSVAPLRAILGGVALLSWATVLGLVVMRVKPSSQIRKSPQEAALE